MFSHTMAVTLAPYSWCPMFDEHTHGRIDALREILSVLQDPSHGGRTEAYEFTVEYIKKALM